MKKIIKKIERKFGCAEGEIAKNGPRSIVVTGITILFMSAIAIGIGESQMIFVPMLCTGLILTTAGIGCTYLCKQENQGTHSQNLSNLEQPTPEASPRVSAQTISSSAVPQTKDEFSQPSNPENKLLNSTIRSKH